jgi:hypothetical protein
MLQQPQEEEDQFGTVDVETLLAKINHKQIKH